ncbi:hypothetical protein ACE5IS_18600 [Leptospira wolffii]|uniref:Lipoprotein n=1 Tax=Leptospira wolffii TaxID=409998 RepID=A0A2M9ZH10_9LEPT|nr:hypothetical protein [Leptospira wolffii]EPG64082.1 putative lipoprotein [Leptospira wolffii serovar Khorat str. Khorat-H2]PJZ67729.1 hypothetical protein CH371_06945 [Leptospira wolffii]TGK62738.1 hypothetical protein EHQ32_08005 [Leptospira wolffii]TGK73875.1 hypothetical protein EHQ35_05760 [Leptospira wolffii]TGK75030.1 hypothetical protein EHQ27_05595 [Leptospira wolffii]
MKRLGIFFVLSSWLLTYGCSSTPTVIPVQPPLKTPEKDERIVSFPVYSESCGFQLFFFIPISTNGRQQTAMAKLQVQAYGGTLSDIKMTESWFYGLVGTGYCTKFSAIVSRVQ